MGFEVQKLFKNVGGYSFQKPRVKPGSCLGTPKQSFLLTHVSCTETYHELRSPSALELGLCHAEIGETDT